MINRKTICPKCKKEFDSGPQEKEREHDGVCPTCNYKFDIKIGHPDTKSKNEISWIEHGEPRKTILSSIRPRSCRPLIAAIILVCVFAIGLSTSLSSESFVTSTLDLASSAGVTGAVEIIVNDELNNTIENATIEIGGVTGSTNENGVFYIENVDLGIKTIEISCSGYETLNLEILVTPVVNFEKTIRLKEGSSQTPKVEYDSSACSMILAIFSIFALVAALCCLKRKYLDVALVGSFFGIFSFGFFFIGSVLSIIALLLIFKSRDEFEDENKGKIF